MFGIRCLIKFLGEFSPFLSSTLQHPKLLIPNLEACKPSERLANWLQQNAPDLEIPNGLFSGCSNLWTATHIVWLCFQ